MIKFKAYIWSVNTEMIDHGDNYYDQFNNLLFHPNTCIKILKQEITISLILTFFNLLIFLNLFQDKE